MLPLTLRLKCLLAQTVRPTRAAPKRKTLAGSEIDKMYGTNKIPATKRIKIVVSIIFLHPFCIGFFMSTSSSVVRGLANFFLGRVLLFLGEAESTKLILYDWQKRGYLPRGEAQSKKFFFKKYSVNPLMRCF